MDKELCNVIDKIAEKIGVVIDWSKENVMPYIQDIMQRYRTKSIVENIIVMTVCAIIITICVILVINWFDADYDEVSTFLIETYTITAISLLMSVIVLCGAAGKLIGWLYVPEVEFLGVLKGLM